MVTKNNTGKDESFARKINRKDIPMDVVVGGEISPAIKGVLDGLARQLDEIIHPEVPAPKSPSDDR